VSLASCVTPELDDDEYRQQFSTAAVANSSYPVAERLISLHEVSTLGPSESSAQVSVALSSLVVWIVL
jgi:hypothetical protein